MFKILRIIAFPFIWLYKKITAPMSPETQEERTTIDYP